MRRFDHAKRRSALAATLDRLGVDACVLSVGPDLPYLTGYEAMPSERLTALVLRPEREPILFIPELEAPRADVDVEVVAWGELQEPVALVASALGGPSSLAVGDHMWSGFLVDLMQHLGEVDLLRASELTRSLRVLKDPEEQAALREAAAAVDRVLARIPQEVRFAGRAESDIARDISGMTLEEGHHTSEFNIVASGPNGASPHHDPGSRLVEPGDLVVCDFGGRLDGYCSDVTRTFAVGQSGPAEREVHNIVAEANQAARDAVMPGVTCESIDRTARTLIERQGYGDYFIHRTGHGIGLEVHEHPYIVEGNDEVLEAGMAFSVEPGVYLKDRFGVRIEDIVLCLESGSESLNQASRELVIVE